MTGEQTGPGSIAGFGPRVLGFIVDAILADLLAVIVNGGYHASGRQNISSYLAFLLIEVVFVAVAGPDAGHAGRGHRGRPGRRTGSGCVAVGLLRTVLLAAIVPALFTDGTGRAMHDRAAGTVTIRTR